MREMNAPPSETHRFLASGGEMAKLVRSKDWSKTPLGPIETWPQSLRTAVSLCLASNFPISLAWGPERVQIYNDGYWPICGAKHPHSMGQDFKQCWFSAWPAIGEAFESASGGEAAFLENQRMFLDRHGYLEETFFTFSFSPIRDESGAVAGLFHPVTELTQQTLAERRLRVLRDLADRTGEAHSVTDAGELIVQTLADHQLDLPFACLYLLDPSGQQLRLAGATGVSPGSSYCPQTLAGSTASQQDWPLFEAIRANESILVDDIAVRFGELACGPYPESPHSAFVLPITVSGMEQPIGALLAGLSPRRPLDESYRIFYRMLQESATSAIANARAYEEERKRAEALAELDQAKTAFFSNVSHEFRTPLTLMLGPVENLLQDGRSALAPAEREQLDLVHRSSLRLLKLVNTLLDFSRIEAGRVQASYEPTDLADYTAGLAGVFRSAIEKAGLRLKVSCPPLSEAVYVDRDMWEKIVLKLMSNAFKFTFEGEIEVNLEQTEDAARLTVRDTGAGIPSEELPRIFERFHRVRGSQGRTHEGSGIGLALVRELAKLHGGSVSAESEIGRGSRFVLTVPLGKSHLDPERVEKPSELASSGIGGEAFEQEALRWISAAAPNVEPPATDAQVLTPDSESGSTRVPAASRDRIIWADDNSDMRQYVSDILGQHFDVEAVADGEAALEAARATRPDLVLTDVMMPKLDGFGLLRALRDDPALRDVPVILLSARAGEESRTEGLQVGADDYLVKPFSARELLARVGSHLKLARMRRESTERLIASQRELSDLFETASVGLHWVGPDGIILRANQAELDMLGYTREEYVGRHLADFYVERPVIEDILARLARGERLHEYPARLRRKDGSIRDVVINTSVLFEKGEFVHTRCFTTDVTERKRAEEALRESERRFREIIDALPAAVYTTDAEGRLTHFNPACIDFAGRTPDLASDRWCVTSKVFHPDGRPMPYDDYPMVLALRECRAVQGAEVIAERPDGTRICFEPYPTPLFDSAGKLIGGINMLVDVTERKRTEQSLRDSEERYRQTLSLLPAAVYSCDASGHITYYNDRAAELWGRKPELGDTDERFCGSEQLILPDGTPLPHAECPMAVALREGRSCRDAEVHIRRPDASTVPVMVNVDPICDERGAVVGAINVFHDISAMRESEEALRRSEERFRALTNATSDAVYRMSPDWGELRQLRGREFVADTLEPSRTWLDKYLHPDDQQHVLKTIREAVQSKGVFALEHRVLRVDGSLGWTYSRAIPILDHRGEIVEWFGAASDVTQRKRTEDALRESEERFRMVADNISQLAWTCDELGKVTWYNRRWLEYTGLSFEEMRDWGWTKVHHPDHVDRVVANVTRSRESGEIWDDSYPLRGKDGEYRWFLSRAVPIRSGEGDTVRWFGTNTDITEQRLLQESLREADRRKDEFLATLAHELRNPLAPISTGLEVMKSLLDNRDELDKIRGVLERQTQQLVTLVNDLMEVSRISRGKLELRKRKVTISEIVQSAQEAVEPLIAEAGQELTVNLPKQPIELEADPHRLAQVVSNLLDNAAKYTPRGGRIRLAVTRRGDQVAVTITDTGVGISDDQQAGIFDMFTQIRHPFETVQSGLGIGLTLVRSLVDMHGGDIAVRSEGLNKGSEFTVRLPISTTPAATGRKSSAAEEPTAGGAKRRILIVDDNREAADMTGRLIEALDHEVRIGYDGQQAIELAEQFRPELILMDLGMPGMNGYEAASRIRERPWGVSVTLVALTGWGQHEDQTRSKEAGFNLHLVKPAARSDLQRLLAELPKKLV